MLKKKGVSLGGLAPIMGTTLRTAFSLLLLALVSYPCGARPGRRD